MKQDRTFAGPGLAAMLALVVACDGAPEKAPAGGEADAPVRGDHVGLGAPPEIDRGPPPISGGTLGIAPDGVTAVAADPDRDQIYLARLDDSTVRTIALRPGDEPGRVAFDASRAYVAMRRAGDIATIDLATATMTRTHVCDAPRGLAFESGTNLVHVACAEGVLVSMAPGGTIVRRAALERDLRDVVPRGDGSLYVSVFRKAQILVVDGGGKLASAWQAGGVAEDGPTSTAWRLASAQQGVCTTTSCPAPTLVLIGQATRQSAVSVGTGGYGSSSASADCPRSIVSARLEVMSRPDLSSSTLLPAAVLPVDVATNGETFAIVAAGNGRGAGHRQVFLVARADIGTGACSDRAAGVPGQAIAAAFDGKSRLVVQSREPAALYVMSDRGEMSATIALSGASRADAGHDIFHSTSGANIACASCHNEGGDDGSTWTFDAPTGPVKRRTPSLRGTIAHTEPFHWSGDEADMTSIVKDVFVKRMGGPPLTAAKIAALQGWVYRIPAPPRPATLSEAAVRGQVAFASRGCDGCHAGPMLTNNKSESVGTGGYFQVPSLVGVSWRAPFLHDGCALTLDERFTSKTCNDGDKHGRIVDMSAAERADLVAYLEAL